LIRRARYGLLAALGLAIGLGVPLILGGEALLPLLARISLPELGFMLGMIFVGWNLNAARLRLLAGPAGARLDALRALAVILATEFAICATPGGSGGPLTYVWLLRLQGIDSAQAVALYTADQLMDLAFFLTALCVLLLYWLTVPEGLHLVWQAALMVGFLVLALGSVWALLNHYRPLFLVLGRVLRHLRVSRASRQRLARWALRFRQSLRIVQRYPRWRLLAVYALCTGHWLLRYSILFLAVRAVGGAVSWSYAFLVQMLSLGAGQATLLPGGSGGAETAGVLLLAPQLEPSAAAAAVLVWRFVTFYWYLIAGAPVFATLAGKGLWERLRAGATVDQSASGAASRSASVPRKRAASAPKTTR